MDKLTPEQIAEIREDHGNARHGFMEMGFSSLGLQAWVHYPREQLLSHITALEAENTVLRGQIKIADGYLCSLVLSHPHLVPNEKVGENEYRLTIYDTEQEQE